MDVDKTFVPMNCYMSLKIDDIETEFYLVEFLETDPVF